MFVPSDLLRAKSRHSDLPVNRRAPTADLECGSPLPLFVFSPKTRQQHALWHAQGKAPEAGRTPKRCRAWESDLERGGSTPLSYSARPDARKTHRLWRVPKRKAP